MIDNCAFLVTCSETHTSIYALYQPAQGPTRHGRHRQNYVNYIEKLTGMETDELGKVSQDREAWRELVS